MHNMGATQRFLRGLGLLTFLIFGISFSATAQSPLPIVDKDVHMGVFSCAGSTCHGAAQPWKNVNILQNEFVTWQRRDKHAKAYNVLLNKESKRIARNLGLKSAETADMCLDCHADNVPVKQRHRTFQLSDGVSCEACHGGAGRWVGTHIAANASHENNIKNGLFPTANPETRATLCLGCHLGDKEHRMTHRIMGAGHPRLSFELDTFTALQPAHFKADADYRKRKGSWNGVQVWAIGQAVALNTALETLIDPKRGRDGLFPELVLFDCQACHRPMSGNKWQPRSTVGLGPGRVRLNDANLLMLQIITRHIDSGLADTLKRRARALHKASQTNFGALVEQAKGLHEVTSQMVKKFSSHKFGKGDLGALLKGVVQFGLSGQYVDYHGAEQATMALGVITSAMRDTGAINGAQFAAINKALGGVYKAVEKDEGYDPRRFVAALRTAQKALPK